MSRPAQGTNFIHGRSPLRNVQSAQDIVNERTDNLIINNRLILFNLLVCNASEVAPTRRNEMWMQIANDQGEQLLCLDFTQYQNEKQIGDVIKSFNSKDRVCVKTKLINFFTMLDEVARRLGLSEGGLEAILLKTKVGVDGHGKVEPFFSFVMNSDPELFAALRDKYPAVVEKFLAPTAPRVDEAGEVADVESQLAQLSISTPAFAPPPYVHPPSFTPRTSSVLQGSIIPLVSKSPVITKAS